MYCLQQVAGGRPELPWFLEAASQFLSAAHAALRRRRVPPRATLFYDVELIAVAQADDFGGVEAADARAPERNAERRYVHALSRG